MLQNSYNQEIIKTSDSLVNILPISKERKFIHTVSFIWIWLIFIRNNLCLKSPLKMNLSPSSTSFPLGLLIRTRALPQASDCNVLRNSLSSGWGEKCRHRLALKWMTTLNKNKRNHTFKDGKQRHAETQSTSPFKRVFKNKGTQNHTFMTSVFIPIPVAILMSSKLNPSPSLNMRSTRVWKRDTWNSFFPWKKTNIMHEATLAQAWKTVRSSFLLSHFWEEGIRNY